jgi:hypothetical protein
MGMPKELKPNKKRPPKKKTKAAKKKPSKKKAAKKKKATSKGQRVRATRAATGAGATKKAQSFDKKINDILEKMGHPVDYPLQISDPINCMHTGLFMLDLILCGGYRKGRLLRHRGERRPRPHGASGHRSGCHLQVSGRQPWLPLPQPRDW